MEETDLSPLAGVPVPQINELDLTAHGVFQHFVASGRRAQLLTFLLALDRMDKWAVDFDEMSSPNTFDIQLYLEALMQFVAASSEVLPRVPREFADLLANVGNVGVTFGGGCYFGHGVWVIGTARITIDQLEITP